MTSQGIKCNKFIWISNDEILSRDVEWKISNEYFGIKIEQLLICGLIFGPKDFNFIF